MVPVRLCRNNLPILLIPSLCTVEKTAEYPYGNFAWLKDPDGNPVELWEPSESECP
jgi:hypothetical protein